MHFANLILQINKLRYKDGKEDPRGFNSFLAKHNLPRCILPRYRGNRLHVLYVCGPWMKRFYTSAETEINFVEGIRVVEKVSANIKVAANSPQRLLTESVDLFGDPLIVDATMSALRNGVAREDANFSVVMKCCLIGIIDVIDRQYAKYSSWDLDLKLQQETKSARSHNIDAEEIMGMFPAAKKRSPNATLCYLSCRLRATKNRTVAFLDTLNPDEKEMILHKAIYHLGAKDGESSVFTKFAFLRTAGLLFNDE